MCIPKVLVPRERWIMRGFVAVIIICSCILIFNNYLSQTQTEPKIGGKYTEGLLGQPRYINPILSQTNDVDRDLAEIIFSRLFTYDNQGNIVPGIAQSYTISEDGLVYEIKLKDNINWHDGERLTAEDIIFTIKTIQDKAYGSPLRIIWDGIAIEQIDELTVKFTIQNPYAPFLHNLTFGILPKHLWAGISGQNFQLADHNLFNPIGSGPYKFKDLNKNAEGEIQSITLVRHEGSNLNPFIETVIFKFYNSHIDLINAYKQGQIDGFTPISAINQPTINKDTNVYSLNMPIYHAVFFNQTESKPLSDKSVRTALRYATDKKEILEKVLQNQGTIINSPLLIDLEDINFDFDLEKAKELLEESYWTDTDDDGILDKEMDSDDEEPVKLEINLITTDWPELNGAAELLKEQWEKVGAIVNLEIIDPMSMNYDYIKTRNYQALLFGEILGADPDPFAFWHSSQKKDPGLNLSMYQNKDADKLLEDGRQELDPEKRIEKYKEFQKLVAEDAPAIFLYSPTYLYSVDNKVKGISLGKLSLPSQRFCQIENWYINTKRIEKH
ncbi:ABC transporter substrate-binding protein [Patescibacteria group bacterium]